MIELIDPNDLKDSLFSEKSIKMLKDRSVNLKDLLNIYRIITQIYEEDPTIPLLEMIED